jgi:hypothetical protein
MSTRFFGLLILAILPVSGCLKEPGIGGTSTITGKVFAHDYNAEGTNLRASYYAPDEDVYIIYGNDSIFSDRTQTSYDGSYRFEYLRPGTYTLFAYSKNMVTKLPPPVPVKKTVQIQTERQIVQVEDIVINK